MNLLQQLGGAVLGIGGPILILRASGTRQPVGDDPWDWPDE